MTANQKIPRVRSLCAATFASVLSVAVAAQTPVRRNLAKGYATITQSDLRSDLSYIASDKLEGRLSLRPGDEAGVRWIEQHFRAAGLIPAATDAAGRPSYLQPFTLVEYRPDRAASTVTLSRGGVQTVWHAPQAIGGYRHSVDLSAPVVFAGYGITAPELGYDDYQGIDVRGKIVLAFDHEPQEDDPKSIFNGTGNTRFATTRVKMHNAQAHGAVALIVVAEPNRKHPTNAERQARMQMTRAVPLAPQAIADDELHLPAVVIDDAVESELFAPAGAAHHRSGLQEAAALQSAIDKELKPQSRELPETSLTLHLRNREERTGITWNVAGLLEGSDATLKADTILITAHHDHDGVEPCNAQPETPRPAAAAPVTGVDEDGRPIAAGPNCVQTWHGADDNGSGTVGVVELAKAFATNGVRPKRSILFVVFASEERGLLGAYYMTQHPLRPLATTRAQINFDMIGRDERPSTQTDGLITIPPDTSNRLNLIGALYSPQYDTVVKEENAHVGLILDDRFDHESALNVFFRSDQFPFVLHNIPAFWWFTGFHPDYHHITDTADKIDYAKMQKILDLAYLSAWRFADDAKTPEFVTNPIPAAARQ